jgi:hypothetical protein
LVLSPRSQALSGPGALVSLVLGHGAARAGMALGLPRAELFGLIGIAFAVALASVAITLGLILTVSRQTPFPRAAVASIACGALTFLLAVPLFFLMLQAAAA